MVCLLAGVAISIVIALALITLRYTASGDDDKFSYGPTDSRIISISNILCQEAVIRVSDTTSQFDGDISLYSLSSPPLWSGSTDFSLKDQLYSDGSGQHYYEYHYYMPENTFFELRGCLSSDDVDASMYAIKGRKNFETWKKNITKYWYHVEESERIFSSCDYPDSLTYTVSDDNFYYLVFAFEENSIGSINISVTIRQTHYDVGQTVINSCSVATTGFDDTCSVGVTFSGTATLLMKVTPPEDHEIDWRAKVYVEVGCSPRIWMYFVIGLASAILVYCSLLYCFYSHVTKGRKVRSSRTIPVAESVNAPLLAGTGPPHANYGPHDSASTGQGSNYIAPPPYQE